MFCCCFFFPQSWIKRTKYHQKRVLRQEEDKDVDPYHTHSDTYVDTNPSAGQLEEVGGNPPPHHLLYTRENMDPIIETNRLVIVDEEPPSQPLPPTRKDVIPALERHILTGDRKGLEHLKAYSPSTVAKRPKQVAMVTEDLTRPSRNEGICAL